jgi:hypothetical protein
VASIPSGNGFAQMTAFASSGWYGFGLSNSDPDQNYASIKWGIFSGYGNLIIINDNNTTHSGFGTYNINDLFRVAVEGTTVKYYRQPAGQSTWILLYTSPVPVSYPLYYDTSIAGLGDEVMNAYLEQGTCPTPTPTRWPTCNVYEIARDVSPPLRTMQAASAPAPWAVIRQPSLRELEMTGTAQTDPVLQTLAGPLVNANLGLHFDGVGFGVGLPAGATPPDPNGAVGAFQFIEWSNLSFAIFSKATGALVYGPVPGNTLWSGFQDGGHCANYNSGDPIVLYDHLANRWIMTQVAVGGGNYVQCLAVSAGVDATGPWYRYAFLFPGLNDYPKLGVWPDAYYMSFNLFNPPARGTAAVALDRNAMISGGPSSPQCFQPPWYNIFPSDLEGSTLPPPGSPNYYVGVVNEQALLMFRFHVDFSAPGNSNFVGPILIPVAPFNLPCTACIPQAGTTWQLDTGFVTMRHRVTYRNFGDHESMVLTHGTAAPTAHVGMRWYELRNPGGNPPQVYQQGTFSPDSTDRWMGSIAMDGMGNIALGYSASDSSIHPDIRYTGWVPTDPLGTMEAEARIPNLNNQGSQTTSDLWGDYTSMSVDPVFDCTFWYTNEYFQHDGQDWSTHVASFRFPSCVGCVGDCNRDHVVTVDEILTMVNISLGSAPIINCLRGDGNGDGVITVDEITQAINNDLNGCPVPGLAPVQQGGPLPGPIVGQEVTQQIGSASGARGTTITIPVTLKNGGGMVSATALDLLYPSAVLGNPSCVEAPRLTGHSLYTSLPSDPPASAGERRLRAMVIDLNSASTFADGQIFACTFTILTSAQPGTYSITGDRQNVSDHSGDELISTVSNGSVTVHK